MKCSSDKWRVLSNWFSDLGLSYHITNSAVCQADKKCAMQPKKPYYSTFELKVQDMEKPW